MLAARNATTAHQFANRLASSSASTSAGSAISSPALSSAAVAGPRVVLPTQLQIEVGVL
jgi:hypothetical protein